MILNKIIRIGSDKATNMIRALKIFERLFDHHYDPSVDDNENEFNHYRTVEEDFENFVDIDAEIDNIPNSGGGGVSGYSLYRAPTYRAYTVADISDNFQQRCEKNELIDKLRAKELLPIWGRVCVCNIIQLAVQDYLENPPDHHDNITQLLYATKKYIKITIFRKQLFVFFEQSDTVGLNIRDD